MPYGYDAKKIVSSRGRARKFTERAKFLLAEQAKTTMNATFRDIQNVENGIKKDLAETGQGSRIVRAVQVWDELKFLAEETLKDLQEYGSEEDVRDISARWARQTADMAILEQDVKDYLSLNPADPEDPGSDEDVVDNDQAPKPTAKLQEVAALPDPGKEIKTEGGLADEVQIKMEDLENISRRFEEEIKVLQEQLDRSKRELSDYKKEEKSRSPVTQGPVASGEDSDPSGPDHSTPATDFERGYPLHTRHVTVRARRPERVATPEETFRPGEGERREEPGGGPSEMNPLERSQLEVNRAMVQTLERINQSMEDRDNRRDLPVAEPELFNGDPLAFPAWWNSFRMMIVERARSNRDRLHYLCKYTTGEPKKIADSFMTSFDPDAYLEARDFILDRFGNKMVIAQAFKDKLNRWPAVREGDGPALQRLSDFLWSCLNALHTVKYLADLNTMEENLRIVRKLPRHIMNRWIRQMDGSMYSRDSGTQERARLTGEPPSFRKFCFFLADEARIANNPYSRALQEGNEKTSEKRENRECKRHHSMATKSTSEPRNSEKFRYREASKSEGGPRTWTPTLKGKTPYRSDNGPSERPPPSPKCVYCGGDHWVQDCNPFLKMSRQQKRAYADEHRMCYGCLRTNHMVKECRKKNPQLMAEPEAILAESAKTMRTSSQEIGQYSMILPVWIAHAEDPENKILTYALIDSQSDSSFVTDALADRLSVEKVPVDLDLVTMNSSRIIKSNRLRGLRVWGEERQKRLELKRCYTVGKIPGSYENIPDPQKMRDIPHLQKVVNKLKPPRPELEIGILIGTDCPRAMVPIKTVVDENSDVFGYLSPLGWMVLGPHSEFQEGDDRARTLFTKLREPVSMEKFRSAFDAEFSEDRGEHSKMSSDDRKFLKIVSEGARQREDGHFEIPLPFRQEPENLPDSRPNAIQRLESQRRKMMKNRPYAEKYVTFMKNMIEGESQQAEPVPLPDTRPKGKRWYWCHHGVESEHKPDVVRGVFDGSARVGGVAINDLLLQGPDLANNLAGVLCRFREELIPITCDIEGMFHQVFVPEEFRDYLRFLWFENHDYERGRIVEYRMCVHLFGATSSPACANFALRETAKRHGHKYPPAAAEFLQERFYVDDGLGSQADTDAAVSLMKDSHSLCREGGFNLHKFTCGETEALQALNPELVAKDMRDFTPDATKPEGRVLGLTLSREEDAFKYNLKTQEKKPTRRNCLSMLSSVRSARVREPLLTGGSFVAPGPLLCRLGLG